MFQDSELASWVRPDLLQSATVKALRAQFLTNNMKMVMIDQFLQDSVAATIAQFLIHEAQYKTMYALYPSQDRSKPTGFATHITKSTWQAAAMQDRFFRFDQLVEDSVISSSDAAVFDKFYQSFQTSVFRNFFEYITKRRLGRMYPDVHRMRDGDYIGLHTDDWFERSLGLLLYLTPGWTQDKGGILRIHQEDKSIIITPEFNRLILFDVRSHQEHLVTEIKKDFIRISFGAWYIDGTKL